MTFHPKKQSWERGKHTWSPNTYMGLVNKPETFLQLLLSPPQTLHLSNFFLEPSFPSQPALMHLPCTQTEVESGEQGVPSTTCTGVSKTSCCISLGHPTNPQLHHPTWATRILPAGPEEMVASTVPPFAHALLCCCTFRISEKTCTGLYPFFIYMMFNPFLLQGTGCTGDRVLTNPLSSMAGCLPCLAQTSLPQHHNYHPLFQDYGHILEIPSKTHRKTLHRLTPVLK